MRKFEFINGEKRVGSVSFAQHPLNRINELHVEVFVNPKLDEYLKFQDGSTLVIGKHPLYYSIVKLNYKVGLTGNYYFTSTSKDDLQIVCQMIDKSENSIYWNKKYGVFAIRIKDKNHKVLVKQLWKRG